MNNCALSRIRTHDRSDRGAADLHLRPHGQLDSVKPYNNENCLRNNVQIRNYCCNFKIIQGGYSYRTEKLYGYYLYCCTLHFEDSLSITHQRMHKLYIIY
jgi:hypothetical protein